MTTFKLGHWLLVALALVGLALVVPLVGAHGNETTAGDAPGDDGTAAEWADWMDSHVTDHMGPDGAEQMESHMGVSVDEMARDMAAGDHGGGMGGQGHGC